MTKAPDISMVVGLLAAEYGLPRHGNPRGVLEDLVYIILSNRSTRSLAAQAYRRLRRRYDWSDIPNAPLREIHALLRPLGLHRRRAVQLRYLLRVVAAKYGEYSLETLRQLSDEDAYTALVSLPGVSTKVAKCVQLYTMGAEVLPVDIHVFRVSKRLGYLKASRPALSHDILEAKVPSSLRHTYHVTCVAHGRAVCRSVPSCATCVLAPHCPTSMRHV